jgi:hypothetical protein
MNINYIIILIFIVLILSLIIYIIIRNINVKIEPFQVEITYVQIPDIKDDRNVNITTQSYITDTINNNLLVNTIEGLDIIKEGNYEDSFTLTSSYIVESPNKISSLLLKNEIPGGVKLISPKLYKENGAKNINSSIIDNSYSFYNYINITFPFTNIGIRKIELDLINMELFNVTDFNNGDMPNTSLALFTSDTSVYRNIGIVQNINNNNKIVIDINANEKVQSNLYILISARIKTITFKKIKILISKKEKYNVVTPEQNIIKFSSSNEYEQIMLPEIQEDTGIDFSDFNQQQEGQRLSITKRFNTLLRTYIPWGIYDGKRYNNSSKRIPDLLYRECKDAIVSGNGAVVINPDNVDSKIGYLGGTTETIVEFPSFSLPKQYTICAITRYTNKSINDVSKRGRILTGKTTTPNWLLGHWWGMTGMMHNDRWNTSTNGSLSGNVNEWIVSCAKSMSNSTPASVLFNGQQKGTTQPGEISNYNEAINNDSNKIVINSSVFSEKSDFGLSYIIIWDKILSDNQLKLVSDALNYYVESGIEIDISKISVNVNDGSTQDKAGISALDIKRNTCTNRNGFYWILPKGTTNTANAKQIYCIMDNKCHGGGWMLAMKGRKNSNTFVYHSSHWSTDSVLNENDVSEDFTDAKYNIFNNYEAKDIMAIFDGNDTNGELTFPEIKEYGWIWKIFNFNKGTRISLLDFYKPREGYKYGYSTYIYTTQTTENLQNVINYVNAYSGAGGTYIAYNDFNRFFTDVTCLDRNPLNRKIFSHQEAFKAWGLNVIPVNWNHKVRWGGSFNENNGYWEGVPSSNDVSCGIGLENRNYSAGDAIGCCQSTAGTNASMGFKLFVR